MVRKLWFPILLIAVFAILDAAIFATIPGPYITDYIGLHLSYSYAGRFLLIAGATAFAGIFITVTYWWLERRREP